MYIYIYISSSDACHHYRTCAPSLQRSRPLARSVASPRSLHKEQVDGFVRELTFAKQLEKAISMR